MLLTTLVDTSIWIETFADPNLEGYLAFEAVMVQDEILEGDLVLVFKGWGKVPSFGWSRRR